MHASASLAVVYNVSSSLIADTYMRKKALGIRNPFWGQESNTRSCNKFSSCRASQDFPVTEFNLYELLGVEVSSDTRKIKEAYRALQKRCHPDIAGPPGHDMAIVLNEAYSLLSDPNSRMAYDKELAKVTDLLGYTGMPIYSAWFGSESEQRAVFVDEVKCVGCLKCALFAQKTFSVESVYGRARVVAQWADPENKIHDAIGACPVDCISIVERSDLPSLEFVMSKQPRGRVRIGAGNTADIFDEVEKFRARYAQNQASKSKDCESQRASKASAVQAIQMISNWLYWKYPSTDAAAPLVIHNSARKHAPPSLKKLKAAAAARKQAKTTASQKQASHNYSDYWVPAALALPYTTTPNSDSKPQEDPRPTRKKSVPTDAEFVNLKNVSRNPRGWVVPTAASIVAAVVVQLQLREPSSGLKDHIGGSLPLAIVNSSWTQVALAGVTWYLIGMYILEIVEAIRRK